MATEELWCRHLLRRGPVAPRLASDHVEPIIAGWISDQKESQGRSIEFFYLDRLMQWIARSKLTNACLEALKRVKRARSPNTTPRTRVARRIGTAAQSVSSWLWLTSCTVSIPNIFFVQFFSLSCRRRTTRRQSSVSVPRKHWRDSGAPDSASACDPRCYHGWKPSSPMKAPLGPSSGSMASCTMSFAASDGRRSPRRPLMSVAQ
jgi:hypothetical protein